MIILVILNYEMGYRRENKDAEKAEDFAELNKLPVQVHLYRVADIKERTLVYHLFKRQSIDTDLLYQICMVLNVDLFSLFSEKLREENDIIGACHSQKTERVSSKRKIMLEVELDDEEYQKMIQKALNI